MQTKLTLLFIFFALHLSAQDVRYEFANAQISNSGGNDFYEVDILVSSTAGFKMGSGQLYFDYNPQAFGNSVFSNGRMTVTTSGYLLGQTSGPFGLYTSFTENDNTAARISFSWQQALSSGCIPADNVSAVTAGLFHLQIQFIPGGTAFAPGVCFTSAGSFDDQTFTACGPGASCNFPDCGAEPGIQIINDAFDCSNAPLPAELLSFEAEKNGEASALLHWTTATEQQLSHFEIERSTGAKNWNNIGKVAASGFSFSEKEYRFVDDDIDLASTLSAQYYYRLKMVDIDDGFEYSAVRSVSFLGESSIDIYPNPTSWGVNISLPSAIGQKKDILVQVHSIAGKVLMEQYLSPEGGILEFPAFMDSGVYLLMIRGEKGQLDYRKRISLVRE